MNGEMIKKIQKLRCPKYPEWNDSHIAQMGWEDARTTIVGLLTRAHSPAQAEWLPIESAPPYKTLLTIHQDDLYPVCAFYFDQDGQRFWMRIIEGPEDVIRPEEGDHNPLLRPPTHWMYPPDAPLYQPPKDDTQ